MLSRYSLHDFASNVSKLMSTPLGVAAAQLGFSRDVCSCWRRLSRIVFKSTYIFSHRAGDADTGSRDFAILTDEACRCARRDGDDEGFNRIAACRFFRGAEIGGEAV